MIFLTTSYIMVTPVPVQSHLRSDTSDGSTRVPPSVWRPTSHFRLLSSPIYPWSTHYFYKCTEQQVIPWCDRFNRALSPPQVQYLYICTFGSVTVSLIEDSVHIYLHICATLTNYAQWRPWENLELFSFLTHIKCSCCINNYELELSVACFEAVPILTVLRAYSEKRGRFFFLELEEEISGCGMQNSNI
jgi:hypothetical protein